MLDRFEEENPEYFRHLKGDCLCVTDPFGLIKCKFVRMKLKPDLFRIHPS